MLCVRLFSTALFTAIGTALTTDIRWITLDNTLVVRSPGGFYGGVTADNVLSNRSARYPALADLFRALTLVEKQGVGG